MQRLGPIYVPKPKHSERINIVLNAILIEMKGKKFALKKPRKPLGKRWHAWRTKRKIKSLTKQINELDKKFYALVKHANAIENRMRGAVPKEKLAAVINEYHLAANKILRKKTMLQAQRTALQMKLGG